MVLQMRDECCSVSPVLDIDRVLRELQDRLPALDEFSRIGPFGILPLNCESPKTDSLSEDAQDVELIARIATPEMNLSLSQFPWDDMDDLQTWDALETESATALINLRFTPDKDMELFNADTPSQWLITRPTSTCQLAEQEIVSELLIQELTSANGNTTTYPTPVLTDFDRRRRGTRSRKIRAIFGTLATSSINHHNVK